jgi:hypothetical protein
MRYEFTGRLSDIIDYYKDIKKKYGKKYREYEPYAIICASAKFIQMNSTFRNDFYKARKLFLQNPPDRICVESIRFPVSCGIRFSNSFAEQIQSQIEEKTGIAKIHAFPGVKTVLRPFRPNRDWLIDDLFIVSGTVDGKRCTFFQTQIGCSTCVKGWVKLAIPLVWVKCWYPDHPEKDVDFWDESEPVSFEICDGPPDGFPDFNDLPDYILKAIPHNSTHAS